MAAYEVLLLNTAIPQIQAAQAGDTYVVPRDIAFSAALTLSAGTANGVPYLNGSKVLTTGSALTFDGTTLATRVSANAALQLALSATNATNADFNVRIANNLTDLQVSSATPLSFTLGASEQMRLTSTGLGIGTNNPGTKLAVNGTSAFGTGFASADISNSRPTYVRSSDNNSLISFQSSSTSGDGFLVGMAGAEPRLQVTNNLPLVFLTNNTERAQITSGGDFLVGSTSTYLSAKMTVESTANIGIVSKQGAVGGYCFLSYALNNSGTYYHVSFEEAGTQRGSITSNGSATAYNTSSDYRLKDNQQPLTGSGAFIDALKPKTWDWKSGGKGVGFIAHEVAEVSPGTVVGGKDAVDADGKPIMQAMEYGSAEFIANIIAELQSLRARVKALEGA